MKGDCVEVKEFVEPIRKILSPADMNQWLKSPAYRDLTGFIQAMSESVKGKLSNKDYGMSPACLKIIQLLDTISGWIDEIPPLEQAQRFGNKAYRDWHAKLTTESEKLIADALPPESKSASIEMKAYLNDSFGNATRIDYGTGHEACFLILLCCYFKLEVLGQSDSATVVTVVFYKYLCVTRKLQSVYRMEPAGSHGVWSLDDFQFIPFLWGSSQLYCKGHPSLTPESMTDENLVSKHQGENLFFDAIAHILSMKTGPFAEHSNQLWNVSGVPGWGKVNQGLTKMYKAEILGKFPVVQHFLFGSLFQFA